MRGRGNLVRLDPSGIRLPGGRPQPEWTTEPKYETIVRIAPMRWGMTVRRADGSRAVHELGRVYL